MTLPASGTLTASAIRTELSSTGSMNLGRTDVRALANVPSGTLRMSDFYSKTAVGYWIGAITGVSPTFLDSDASGNIYMLGSTSIGGFNSVFVAKYGVEGALVWQRTLAAGFQLQMQSLSVSGVSVYISVTNGNNYMPILVKYNTDGVLQWQKSITTAASGNLSPNRILCDPSDEGAYFVGRYYDNATVRRDFFISKFAADGTLTWKLSRRSTTTMGGARDCVIGPDGSLYVGGGWQPAVLAKTTTAGALTWEKIFGTVASSATEITSVVFDAAGNLYGVGNYYNTSYNMVFIVKYDQAGTYLWAKGYGVSNTNMYPARALYIPEDDRLCILGYKARSNTVTTNDMFVFNIDTSGTIKWANTLSKGTTGLSLYGATYANGALYIGGYGSTGLLLKLPRDGTHLGTYGTYTYATLASFAQITPTLTGSVTMTTPTSTTTLAATTYTDAAGAIAELTKTTV